MNFEIVIAGAGLAGACAAVTLAPHTRVLVLDDGQPGASHAAAGLVNPFLGRKAKRAWRATDALDALARLADASDAPLSLGGLLRPARDDRQAEVFRQRAATHPDRLRWLPADASREAHPVVHAPHGALWVREGGHVEIPRLAAALLGEAQRRGADVRSARLAGWSDGRDGRLAVRTESAETPEVRARTLLLCTGDGTRALAPDLPLHRVKGQTLRLAAPPDLRIPPVSGAGYVVPLAPGEVVVGATFEHTFTSLAPTPEAAEDLRQRAAALVPALAGAAVLEARAGVRLTVPASIRPGRLPLVGPVAQNIWAFTGLGAKGLLTAPLLAQHLPEWLADPDAIWPEVSTLA